MLNQFAFNHKIHKVCSTAYNLKSHAVVTDIWGLLLEKYEILVLSLLLAMRNFGTLFFHSTSSRQPPSCVCSLALLVSNSNTIRTFDFKLNHLWMV